MPVAITTPARVQRIVLVRVVMRWLRKFLIFFFWCGWYFVCPDDENPKTWERLKEPWNR